MVAVATGMANWYEMSFRASRRIGTPILMSEESRNLRRLAAERLRLLGFARGDMIRLFYPFCYGGDHHHDGDVCEEW